MAKKQRKAPLDPIDRVVDELNRLYKKEKETVLSPKEEQRLRDLESAINTV